ncbi:MAG: FixH family protein [Pseudomonadota bacterium]
MSDKNISKPENKDLENRQWWRYGHAWLVFGGPAVVVVACIITVYIAVKAQDPVIDEDYYRHGIEINKTLEHAKTLEERNALEPALRARNHAATGVNQQD